MKLLARVQNLTFYDAFWCASGATFGIFSPDTDTIVKISVSRRFIKDPFQTKKSTHQLLGPSPLDYNA